MQTKTKENEIVVNDEQEKQITCTTNKHSKEFFFWWGLGTPKNTKNKHLRFGTLFGETFSTNNFLDGEPVDRVMRLLGRLWCHRREPTRQRRGPRIPLPATGLLLQLVLCLLRDEEGW